MQTNDLPQTPMAIVIDKTFDDLSLDLLRSILLRLSAFSLWRLRCVSKTWLRLISDPNFANSHLELVEPAPRCLLIRGSRALSFDLDALFTKGYSPGKVSLRCMEPSKLTILGSCRGFILLDQCPHFIAWNPTTGAHKRISYSHIGPFTKNQVFDFLYTVIFIGFGYNSSEDDYLVVLAWKRDKNSEEHFDFFSMRTNSWKSFEVALPNKLKLNNVYKRCGFFLYGSLHWLLHSDARGVYILAFDLMTRCFSEINMPKAVAYYSIHHLLEVEGCLCLALCKRSNVREYEIWMMKEYKLESSWTKYGGAFGHGFNPLAKSNDGDIVGFDSERYGFSKYSVDGHKLEQCGNQSLVDGRYTMYTQSLISLPIDSGHLDCQQCFAQLEAGRRKRTKRPPNWTHDFYCK